MWWSWYIACRHDDTHDTTLNIMTAFMTHGGLSHIMLPLLCVIHIVSHKVAGKCPIKQAFAFKAQSTPVTFGTWANISLIMLICPQDKKYFTTVEFCKLMQTCMCAILGANWSDQRSMANIKIVTFTHIWYMIIADRYMANMITSDFAKKNLIKIRRKNAGTALLAAGKQCLMSGHWEEE